MPRSDGKLLGELARLPDGPKKTAALAAWFQGLYGEAKSVPVLVGGAAVELYTGGAYSTGDLDFAGKVPKSIGVRLSESGFRREGRHWIHRSGEIFLELPRAALEPDETAAQIRVGGQSVLVIGPEEILVDRLAAWQFFRSAVDGANAFLLWSSLRNRLNQRRLLSLARRHKNEKALRALQTFVRELQGRRPSSEEIENWSSQPI